MYKDMYLLHTISFKNSYAYLQSVVCRGKQRVTKTLNNLTHGFPKAKFRKRGHRGMCDLRH